MYPYLYSFALLLLLADPSSAYTTFKPECTRPEQSVNYVAVPPMRGTLTILWSCLFTIFACTWTLHHLNVPEQRAGRDPGLRGDFKWGLKEFLNKGKWMIITILAPEITIYFAGSRLVESKHDHISLKKYADDQKVPWTLTHSIFANMGGFVVRGWKPPAGYNKVHENRTEAVLGEGNDYQEESPPDSPRDEEAVVQSFPDPPAATTTPKDFSAWTPEVIHLRADTLIFSQDTEMFKLPSITETEIDDRSKGDMFTKSIALFQIIWVCVDVITRAVRHLAVSQLEISVIAFSACAIMIYAIHWSCPKDVRAGICLHQYAGPIPQTVRDKLCTSSSSYFMEHGKLSERIFNDFFIKNKSRENYVILISLLGSTLYGAPHLLAWNFSFPTYWEGVAWKVCSVYCTGAFWVVVPMPLLASILDDVSKETDSDWKRNVLTVLDKVLALAFATGFVFYLLSRAFLLVEIFRTLCFLPPDAYIATWTSNLPGFG